MKVAWKYREERFSPGSVEKDRAIMDDVVAELRRRGAVEVMEYEEADVVFSMARDEQTLAELEKLERRGVRVINSPEGVRMCNNRYELDALLRRNGIAVPPQTGDEGVWVKRGDGSAEVRDDVVLCHTEAEIEDAIGRMKRRGVASWVRQAHIRGDLVKFYGVEGRMFAHSYPTDSGHSKFGLETANGTAQHYAFDLNALQNEADRVAGLTGVSVYGGDAIVREDGSFAIIDFNDWPTFASCRQDAAKAIAGLMKTPNPQRGNYKKIPTMTIKEFNKLQRASYKSLDTEEWLDIYFTRPIGLAFALLWRRLGVTPNMVTITSFFLGAGAGWMFYHTDLWHNICGVVLLMFANFCDSTDGQLARLTNQKSLTGRMLDGAASDVWFFACYLAIALRLMPETIPGTDSEWGFLSFVLCAIAGLWAHATQCRLADYYRQIHLYYLLGKEGSELDRAETQQAIYDEHRRNKNFVGVLFFSNYAKYCRAQERMTPKYQQLHKVLHEKYGTVDNIPQEIRDEIRRNSLPLMKYTNILTHNCRAIMLFIGCLANVPWIYPLFEITVLFGLYTYMHRTHESFSERLARKYE